MQTDAELLTRYVRSGDEAAFAEIARRHGGMVYRVCLRLLGDPHGAEDAAQAAFVVLVRRARFLRKRGGLAAWLHGVARRVALRAIRDRTRRARHEEEAGMRRPARVSGDAAEPGRRAALRALDRELAALPARQRQAVVLRYLEGHREAEAARLAGCAQGTLSGHASKGLARLRERLARRGVTLGAGALTAALAAESGAALPGMLLPSILTASKAVATGAAAGAAGGSVMTLAEGVLKAMFWTKMRAAAVVASAVVVLGAGTPLAYRKLTAAEPREAGPAPAAPVPGEPAEDFVPKGGKIVAKVKLPGEVRGNVYRGRLKWRADDGGLLLAVGKRGIRGDIPDAYSFAPATGELKKLFSLPANAAEVAGWLAGGRVLVQSGSKLYIYDSGGRGREAALGAAVWGVTVSPDGQLVAASSKEKGAPYSKALFMVSAVDGGVRELKPPVGKPAEAGLVLRLRIYSWTPDGKLLFSTAWGGEKPSMPQFFRMTWTKWLYDPDTDRFEKVGPAKKQSLLIVIGQDLALPDGGTIRRVSAAGAPPPPSSPFGPGPGKPRDARPRPSQSGGPRPGGPRPGGPGRTGKVKSGPAEALEILDPAGKVVRRIALDRKALGGADLWPRTVSADGKYLLAATYREMAFHAGAPGSAWEPVAERHVLLDLETGKLVPGFKMEPVRWPRADRVAVMGPSREVLVIPETFKNPKRGIWAISFDGGRKNWAPEKGLPETWAASEMVMLERDPYRRALVGWNRAAMTTRPEGFVRAPGPRYLFVFWNSAKPICAWVSQGQEDEPKDLTWSRAGNLLAFTAGDVLCVWQPTAEPGEAKLKGPVDPEVF